jgi:hypothetical protein
MLNLRLAAVLSSLKASKISTFRELVGRSNGSKSAFLKKKDLLEIIGFQAYNNRCRLTSPDQDLSVLPR